MQTFTAVEAIAYVRRQKLSSQLFFYNVRGWDTYLTLEETFATPTGRKATEGFPRQVKVTQQKVIALTNEGKPIKKFSH